MALPTYLYFTTRFWFGQETDSGQHLGIDSEVLQYMNHVIKPYRRRLTLSPKDTRALRAVALHGGEVRGAREAGILTNTGGKARSDRQYSLSGGLVMARLIELGMITESLETREGVESVVYRLNNNGRELLAKEPDAHQTQRAIQ
jgi:hypothetical protein